MKRGYMCVQCPITTLFYISILKFESASKIVFQTRSENLTKSNNEKPALTKRIKLSAKIFKH